MYFEEDLTDVLFEKLDGCLHSLSDLNDNVITVEVKSVIDAEYELASCEEPSLYSFVRINDNNKIYYILKYMKG